MSSIEFRPFEISDKSIVIEYIKSFYEEEPGGKRKTSEQVEGSCDWLFAHPQCGNILVFTLDSKIIGYSILINFYSNEYGGLILNIDELYVVPEYRSQGIAKRFIQFLIDNKYNDFVAMELEVLPYNTRALGLYERIGFKKSDRSYLMLKAQK